jgi:hypothetical protein
MAHIRHHIGIYDDGAVIVNGYPDAKNEPNKMEEPRTLEPGSDEHRAVLVGAGLMTDEEYAKLTETEEEKEAREAAEKEASESSPFGSGVTEDDYAYDPNDPGVQTRKR